eukprot:scaffold2325_cov105-Isochrysis_galbana.AAC.10
MALTVDAAGGPAPPELLVGILGCGAILWAGRCFACARAGELRRRGSAGSRAEPWIRDSGMCRKPILFLGCTKMGKSGIWSTYVVCSMHAYATASCPAAVWRPLHFPLSTLHVTPFSPLSTSPLFATGVSYLYSNRRYFQKSAHFFLGNTQDPTPTPTPTRNTQHATTRPGARSGHRCVPRLANNRPRLSGNADTGIFNLELL